MARNLALGLLSSIPVLLLPVLAHGIAYCGMPPDSGPPDPLPPVTWHEVPAQLFTSTNPRFAGIFTVYTDWDWSAQNPSGAQDDRWGLTRLREFAHFIVDEDPGAEPNTDLANVILDYFARDEDPGPGIAIQNCTALDEVTRRFSLRIHDTAQYITAGRDYVRVHIKNSGEYGPAQWLLPEQVAKDAFAHEWQHTCHTHYTRGPNPDYTPYLPPEAVIVHEWGLGLGHEFDEMCSKMSEALFGVGREVSTYETLCTNHLLKAPGYMTSCACVDPPSLPEECLEPRYQYTDYALFGRYINEKFSATIGGQAQDLYTR